MSNLTSKSSKGMPTTTSSNGSTARWSPSFSINRWKKSGVREFVKNGFQARNGMKKATNEKEAGLDETDFLRENLVKTQNRLVTQESVERESIAWEYDAFSRVKIVFLNECGIIYEYKPRSNHPGDKVKMDALEEMVFGSVALNFVMDDPVSKIHQVSKDVLTISLVFSGKLCQTKQANQENGSEAGHESSPSSAKFGGKTLGLVVMFDTGPDVSYIRDFVLKQSHLMDCCLSNLREELLNGVRQKSSLLVNEGTRKFLQSVNSVLCAQVLWRKVSLESFVKDLINLIKQIDTKTTNFFLSKLISALLIHKNQSSANVQVILTTSESKIELISRLLLVLRYFLQTHELVEQIFADPLISVPSSPPGLSSSSSAFAGCANLVPATSNNNNNNNNNNCCPSRKSRDESLGYGSLSDSETNVCQTVESMAASNADGGSSSCETSSDSESLKPKVLNQSKLYIKEYQSLRFDQTSSYVEDSRDMQLKSMDIMDTSICKKKSTQSSASSGFEDDDDDLIQDLFESKRIPGFGETSCPPLILDKKLSVNESKFSALTSEPVISDVYLRHFTLQGILLKSEASFKDPLKNWPCKCSEKADIVIHGNVDVWSVNITSAKTKTVVPAIMCTQVGQICESLVALDAIEMKSEFVLGYLECKLNELKLRSRILQSLQMDRCSLPAKAQSVLSLVDYSGIFDVGPEAISPVLGFDVSDLPLLSVLSQSSSARYNRIVKHAETSL